MSIANGWDTRPDLTRVVLLGEGAVVLRLAERCILSVMLSLHETLDARAHSLACPTHHDPWKVLFLFGPPSALGTGPSLAYLPGQ